MKNGHRKVTVVLRRFRAVDSCSRRRRRTRQVQGRFSTDHNSTNPYPPLIHEHRLCAQMETDRVPRTQPNDESGGLGHHDERPDLHGRFRHRLSRRQNRRQGNHRRQVREASKKVITIPRFAATKKVAEQILPIDLWQGQNAAPSRNQNAQSDQ